MRTPEEILAAMELIRACSKRCGLLAKLGVTCPECYAGDSVADALEWVLGGSEDFNKVVHRLATEALKCQ